MGKSLKTWAPDCKCEPLAAIPDLHVTTNDDDGDGGASVAFQFKVRCGVCGKHWKPFDLPLEEKAHVR